MILIDQTIREKFIKEIENVEDDFTTLLKESESEKDEIFKVDYEYEEYGNINDIDLNRIITRAVATIERITGQASSYFHIIEDAYNQTQLPENRKVNIVMGALDALYKDLKSGHLESLPELIHGELFSDYLDMAKYLLDENYKDAAAVIAGSTLEEHLRKLCEKNNISTISIDSKGIKKPKKADTLNSELLKAKVYSLGEQKQIIAWLDIRNNAAHGNYNQYTPEIVNLMIIGLRDFINRYRA